MHSSWSQTAIFQQNPLSMSCTGSVGPSAQHCTSPCKNTIFVCRQHFFNQSTNAQKYEEGVLGQAESSQTLSPPTALRGYFSDSMCICPSACPAGGKDAWKFRISVHDYKTSLKSFLVGAFRTQLNLNSIDLSSGPSSLCPILNGDFCNHLLGRERCSAVSDGGSSATRCAQNIFVSFQNIRIQSPNI